MSKCPETGKDCLTRDEASRRAAAMRSRSALWADKRLTPYKCPHHKKHPDRFRLFHIGHTPAKRRGVW